MDDVPNINPVKPAWPKRPDERNPKKQDREPGSEKNKSDIEQEQQPKSDHDGEIDEYV